MPAQSAILPLPSAHARFIVLNQHQLSLDTFKEKLALMLALRDHYLTQYREANLRVSIAFGLNFWQKLYEHTPEGLHELQPITTGAMPMPASPADVLVHIAAERADLCFALSQALLSGVEGQVQVLDERACFKYLDSRDLTGFIDGTENPQIMEDRAETALLDSSHGVFADGSLVFAQRFVHDLPKFNRLKVDAQEQVFGRSKLESFEMADEVKPKNAHIARVVVEDTQGEELEILRHSLPYGDGSGDQGLFFIAYSKDLDRIDLMLQRMHGAVGDGLHDRLLHFTTPVNGAYFFAPSVALLAQVLAV
ncbi:MAG: Dyp-type peroxidase [Pseudomonadota bacterium]|nr:Dyp-type peroxidase [Pseudomonadota bacterium]